MIKTFGSRLTEALYNGTTNRHTRKFPSQLHKVALRKLDQLNAAVKIEDLNVPPKNKLEKLQGDLSGFWSIRLNNQYRLIFRWKDKNAYDVDLVDYHK